MGGGAEAAEKLVQSIKQRRADITDQNRCCTVLTEIDDLLLKEGNGGETTCALAVIGKNEIFGASVGDSAVWFIPVSAPHVDLTALQSRKPLIGSGHATAKGFTIPKQTGVLMLATDGLLKYAKTELVVQSCRSSNSLELDEWNTLALVRMANGKLQDDATVLLSFIDC
ncbi:MAG: hypothetical protein ACO1QB_06220 [Verrucomicrobiales bacterium]